MLARNFPKTAETENLLFHPVASAQLLGSGTNPRRRTADVMNSLVDFLGSAQESATLCSPYFVLDSAMRNALRTAVNQVPRFKMLTNSAATGNNIIASSDGVFHRGMLRAMDAEVWETQTEFSVHTKAMVMDRETSIVGSFNMDMRSAYLDTEIMLALQCPELAAELENFLDGLCENAIPVSQQARQTAPEFTVQAIPWLKALRIYLLSPLISLVRYLV